MICLPTSEDLEQFGRFNFVETVPDHTSKPKSMESKEIDLNDLFVDTKAAKIENRKLHAKERKKRRKNHAQQSNTDDITPISSQSPNVVDYCSRKIMGFVTNGDFSFYTGRGEGMGFCSSLALKQLCESVPVLRVKHSRTVRPVLLRNANSKCYRMCSIEIQ